MIGEMNELNLYFDENEVHRLYKINRKISKDYVFRFLKKRFFIILVLFSAGTLVFMIGLNYSGFVPFGIALVFTSILLIFISFFQFLSFRRVIRNTFRLPENFIEKYKKIEKVKYLYDDTSIKYFEEEKEQFVLKWKELKTVEFDENSIYLDFEDPERNIWISKRMTIQEELVEFEKLICSITEK